MSRFTRMAVLGTGLALLLASSAAVADDLAGAPEDRVLGAEGVILDDDALGEVSGGTLLGHPAEADSWRRDSEFPMEFPASISAVGDPVAGAAITGADLGHRPPAGDTIGGVGGIAGDIANTIF